MTFVLALFVHLCGANAAHQRFEGAQRKENVGSSFKIQLNGIWRLHAKEVEFTTSNVFIELFSQHIRVSAEHKYHLVAVSRRLKFQSVKKSLTPLKSVLSVQGSWLLTNKMSSFWKCHRALALRNTLVSIDVDLFGERKEVEIEPETLGIKRIFLNETSFAHDFMIMLRTNKLNKLDIGCRFGELWCDKYETNASYIDVLPMKGAKYPFDLSSISDESLRSMLIQKVMVTFIKKN